MSYPEFDSDALRCEEKESKIPATKNEISFVNIFRPLHASEALLNCCTKFYPDGLGGWVPVKRIIFDRPTYNPNGLERRRRAEMENIIVPDSPNPDDEDFTNPRNGEESSFWKKSYNRARQQCFDYIMCNFDLDTFLTFTVDPSDTDSFDYDEIVKKLSIWLDNRVRRSNLKYILVPERHKSGAIHFHGIANREGLKLVSSGYFKLGKYTLSGENIPAHAKHRAREIFNVKDLLLGFSTAMIIEGEDARTKVSKYIWKYMTKQLGQKIGGRYYLHGGELRTPRLVFSNELFEESDGAVVFYGGANCKIETLSF